MAGLVLCEPTELYNILNQSTKLSRLTEPNYLCLLDARTKREYNESHVITARRVKQNPMGDYLVPDSVELECVKYCVVYDGKTSSLDDIYYDDYEEKKEDEKGTKAASEIAGDESSSSCSQNAEVGAAIQCARVLEQFTRHPVRILKGGYERFTACYHFLRTQKIFWMPQELDAFQPYPVEILPAQLYMGNCRQACDPQIQKDLKIKAQVNISEEIATLFTDESKTLLHVSVADSPDADLFSFFPTICHFIDAQMVLGAVLVFSTLGLSRSSTAVMAFLMHSSHYPLKTCPEARTTNMADWKNYKSKQLCSPGSQRERDFLSLGATVTWLCPLLLRDIGSPAHPVCGTLALCPKAEVSSMGVFKIPDCFPKTTSLDPQILF